MTEPSGKKRKTRESSPGEIPTVNSPSPSTSTPEDEPFCSTGGATAIGKKQKTRESPPANPTSTRYSSPSPEEHGTEDRPSGVSEGLSLEENLESLADLLEVLEPRLADIHHQVVDALKNKKELALTVSDIQSFQASLTKFKKFLGGPPRRFKCPSCPKAFARLDRLLVHCDKYHPERPYLKLVCPYPQSFKSLRQRNNHLRKIHKDYYNKEQELLVGGRSKEEAGARDETRVINISKDSTINNSVDTTIDTNTDVGYICKNPVTTIGTITDTSIEKDADILLLAVGGMKDDSGALQRKLSLG